MSYTDERERISNYMKNNGNNIKLMPDRSNEKQYYKELEKFDNDKKIAIRYPGYKTTSTKCDYCVYLVDENGEHPISHVEIMQDLYNKTTLQNYEYMKKYIEGVAQCGKDIDISDLQVTSDDNGFSIEELTFLMFYIAIQEDINYPEQRYEGRKMCFYRYLEAVYCKVYSNHRIDEAINRATTKGYIPKKWNDVGDLYDVVSRIRR